MNCFILPRRPRSYNSWTKNDAKGQSFLKAITESFQSVYHKHEMLTGDLYGTVYYFFKEDKRNDADNLSKPVWDCLNNLVYTDDKQIKLRIAGVFDLNKNDLSQINFSKVPKEVIRQFLDAVENHDHFLYIECGVLSFNFYQFNIEENEV
jgi:Holliday junction resolvase RusA-like endonuclease